MMELMGSQQGCPNTVDSQHQEAAATPGMEGQRGGGGVRRPELGVTGSWERLEP